MPTPPDVATRRARYEQQLARLVESPESPDAFDAAMRRGSIEYNKAAIRAIDKLTKDALCAK